MFVLTKEVLLLGIALLQIVLLFLVGIVMFLEKLYRPVHLHFKIVVIMLQLIRVLL